MWTVSRRGKNIPIEYQECLVAVYESGLTVRFDPRIMTCHWDKCPNDGAHMKPRVRRRKRLCDYTAGKTPKPKGEYHELSIGENGS
jgi:hypothetical protein